MAGYEGREEVASATAGRVVLFWPSREDICSVVVQDHAGFHWEYAHLKSFAPEIVLNARVTRGQKLGLLGRSGPSGNFSHLHLGSYLSRHDLDVDNRDKRLNLFPWLVAAYQAQHAGGLVAIARPHRQVFVGEQVDFDGSNSLIWGGGKIVQWRWTFPDGETVKQAKAHNKFDRPGAYVASLWIKDDKGAEDVDFCQVKVYSRPTPEPAMPHIFMTCTPTQNVRPNQPVMFRFWFQGNGGGPIKVDFDDGTQVADYHSYTELQHAFKTPGVHVVTAQCDAAGKPITQKLKVIVEPEGR
jgi:murein DD-endopeptidase MepM/ murein hydrolase activator NlpD